MDILEDLYWRNARRFKACKKNCSCNIFMASEGMDIPKLNTIILASPKSDVEQIVGRYLDKKHVIKIASTNYRCSR